jgi:hypothetical protein
MVGELKDTERGLVLGHLRKTITLEKGEPVYYTKRDSFMYLWEFQGLSGSFDYIKTLKSNVVVDIGTGEGLAWSELARKYGDDLEFWATNLIYDKEVANRLGGRVKITPAEFMKGFADNSVGGVVAMKSIAYSSSPEMVVKAIDRILVPGGLIKASFKGVGESGVNYNTHHDFTEVLRSLGYDTEVFEDINVLAVKPGGEVKAKDVLVKDLKSVEQKPFV